MISYEEAIQAITAAVPLSTPVRLPIDDAIRYILVEDIIAPINVSPFRNSAMDGFAVRADVLAQCSADNPITFPIAHTVYAGGSTLPSVVPETTIKIMTGAPVPDEFDAIVPVEDCRFDANHATFTRPVRTQSNIRLPGEDITQGQCVFEKGHRIGVLDIGILASLGVAKVSVFRKPSVLVLVTGDELRMVNETLKPGQIYDSNSHTITAIIGRFVDSVQIHRPVRDSAKALQTVLQESNKDIIITSGGVSMGDRDLIPDVLEQEGWKTLFHKVRIKPGKPVLFATKGGRLLFGLPGNPLSIAVTCAVFVVRALRQFAGEQAVDLRPTPVELIHKQRKSNRLLIWPGVITEFEQGLRAQLTTKSSSAALSALLGSDGLIFSDTIAGKSGRADFLPWGQILGDW